MPKNTLFHLELTVKDPDEIGAIAYALGEKESEKYFEYGEYATLLLDVEIVNKKPIVKKAEFAKRS